MAHRPTQRRNSAPSTVPAPSKHPKPSTTTTAAAPLHRPKPNPDLTTQPSKPSFIVKQLSKSLNLGHKHPPPLVDTRLQAKSMSASISPFVNKPKQSITATKRGSKEEKPFRKKKSNLFEGIEKSRNRDVVEEEEEEEEEHGDGVGKRRSSSSVSMVGESMGRRRSMWGSEVELGDVFAINGVKMVSADMPPFMQIHAVDCARKALDSMEKFTSKTLALSLKKEFDGVYGPAWHCIVGTSFGSYVTHSVGGFLYFSMDHKLYILLFKTAVQKVN